MKKRKEMEETKDRIEWRRKVKVVRAGIVSKKSFTKKDSSMI